MVLDKALLLLVFQPSSSLSWTKLRFPKTWILETMFCHFDGIASKLHKFGTHVLMSRLYHKILIVITNRYMYYWMRL